MPRFALPPRLGFVGRVTLIVVAALVVIQLVAASVYYIQRSRATDTGFRLPLPDQIAALVLLIDDGTPVDRLLALRAVNSATLGARIDETAPDATEGRHLPALERSIAGYLEGDPAGAARQISVRLIPDPRGPGGLLEPFRYFFDGRARIVVSLTSGGFLVVETSGELGLQIFGLPAGFWAGIAGFLVALLAAFFVAREARPLKRLAASVERFGTALEPAVLPERGARELRALIRATNLMQARIATLVKDRAFLLGAITHDLATYLTRLRLRVELLPEGDTRDKSIRDVEEMRALVSDALTFARAAFVTGEGEPVDLAALLTRVCDERRGAGPLTLALPAEAGAPLVVQGKPAALARALGNLIDNALAHAGSAEVTLRACGGGAEILVEDRGPGIPAADRDRIFQPFERLEASRNRGTGGSGLGLAIARHTLESHGGRISLDARRGGGSRFRVFLPA